jgi:hypothetical protein
MDESVANFIAYFNNSSQYFTKYFLTNIFWFQLNLISFQFVNKQKNFLCTKFADSQHTYIKSDRKIIVRNFVNTMPDFLRKQQLPLFVSINSTTQQQSVHTCSKKLERLS